jgi:lysophospholipase
MREQFESLFKAHNNNEIFYHIWNTKDSKGTLLVTHGIAEHSECYSDFAKDLNKYGYNVIAYDLRGHGRSEGSRGVVEDFDDYCQDLKLFFQHCREHFKKEKPLFLFGHSMGGLITTKTCLLHDLEDFDGVILSSPCFGLKIEVPVWKEKLAKFGSNWLPNLTLWNEIEYEDLTRDIEKAKKYGSDPLRHDKISPRLFLGMLEGIQFIKEHESEFKWPLLIQLAGQDKICDSNAGIRFHENCSSKIKKIHIYDESLHEIYNDLDRELAIRDLVKFLQKFDTHVASK